MSSQAFVDESGRGSDYHLCAAVVADEDAETVRRVARSFCLPGQRRWHFVHERNSRRRQIVDALVGTGKVTALIYHGAGRDAEVRAEALRELIKPLIDRSVTRLLIESRQGRDDADRQVLIGELRRRRETFAYDHMPPYADPLLWVADAFAWCSSAGGVWMQRIGPITVSKHIRLP